MHPFFIDRVCMNWNSHSRSSVKVTAETTTDLCSFKISTPSSNLISSVLPGARGKVRRTWVESFPRHTLYLCCRQKELHIHIFAPGQSSQQSHSNGIITGMYVVIRNWTTACNWCQRLLIQNSRWKGLVVKPGLPLIWTSALNKWLVH